MVMFRILENLPRGQKYLNYATEIIIISGVLCTKGVETSRT